MRKILTFRCLGLAALCAVARRANVMAVAAGFAAALCLNGATHAQTLAEQIPPSTFELQDAAVRSADAVSTNSFFTASPSVDASYSVLNDQTEVEQAAFGRRHVNEFTNRTGNACNPGCNVRYYVAFDALWLRRENDERFSLSRNTFMPDFDYEFGGRYTVGTMMDCVNGWEFVYAGPFDWQRQAAVTGTASLQSTFQPINGYTAAEVSAFNNADGHTQAYRAQMHSFEFNRRWFEWDVVSTMIGVRYVDYEEDYLFVSTGGSGTGIFQEGVDNQLIGAQVGADMLYPVSLRANVGFKAKAGVYANFDDRQVAMNNAGVQILNAGASDTDVAGLIEMGVTTNYVIVPSVRLTAGYEFWYMPGIATVPEQRPSIISPASGSTIDDSDDLFIHGGYAGVQILY